MQLLRDGKVYDTVKLNAKNNWSYEWVNLDISYKWTVAEKNVPDDYKVSIRKTGITYVITNTYEEEPPPSDDPPTPQNPPNPPATPPNPPEKPPELPQTGQLWWPVPVLLAAGLFFIVFGLIRRKGGNYEE